MLNNFIDFFRSEEDQDPSFIRLTRNILLSVMAVNLAVLPLVSGLLGGDSRNIVAFIILTASLIIEGISLYFTYQGNIILAKVSVPLTLVVAITAIALNTNGVRDTSFLAIPVILTVSAMLLGRRSLVIVTPAVVIAVLIVAYQDLTIHRIPRSIGIDDAIIVPILMVASAGITHLLIQRLNESIVRAQQSEQSQKRENEELLSLRASLEERVQARTVELEYANQTAEKRARQFRAVTQVMSAVSTIQALDELLPRITQVIGEQFNVYHVGVFLLDNKREYAVLRAANSDGGQRMLARKHALSIGQTGLVGFVTATGQARIALDVGADSIYFDNPDLPDTHSEIALPLRYAGQVIGALDVQSIEANAFQPDDVNALSTLADQVAVAINNALTIEEAQKALAEAQSAIGQVTQEAWQVLRPAKLGLGFSYSDAGIKPLHHPINNTQVNEALRKGETTLSSDPDRKSRLAIPIRLRGQVIGVMQLSTRSIGQFSDDDADIANAVADRLSLAIETATLLQSTQHRADIEKITANITSRVSSSSRFETILQTAAQELSRALGGSEVLVQIEPDALQMYS
ncbi:MAG: GAF domain-containing protein [Anaerolineales bacterium]|uniref:GAF domain-containing protein n=1 Tax=Candidatus Villigracilis vicinus TaxID=3140679 RepID=UPI003134E795|nr:GAF domain-containing protein [Anaerolineales bacterium]